MAGLTPQNELLEGYTAEYHDFPLDTLEYHIDAEMARISDYVMSKGTMDTCINPDLEDFTDDDIETPVLIFTIEFLED